MAENNPGVSQFDRRFKIKRNFTLTLDPILAIAVENYMAQEGFQNPSEAVRSLLRIAIAFTPMDGAVEAAKARAFNEVRHFSISRAASFYNELADQLRDQLGMTTIGKEPG